MEPNSIPLEKESLGAEIPEVPNFITLIHSYYEQVPWAKVLHHWENIIFSIIVALLVSLLFYYGTRKKELVPSGLQNFLEMIIDGLEFVILGILGPDGKKYIPFLGTLFIYILVMNFFGIIPFMKSPSSNLNITAALAIIVFIKVQYLNIKNQGFFGFLHHMAGSPKGLAGWAMAPLLFPIEVLTQITRPVTLALRLFGNILGEDILIGYFALLGFTFMAAYHLPVGLPLQIPFMFLALLTSLMQAAVFTLLTTIYIYLSMPSPHEEH